MSDNIGVIHEVVDNVEGWMDLNKQDQKQAQKVINENKQENKPVNKTWKDV